MDFLNRFVIKMNFHLYINYEEIVPMLSISGTTVFVPFSLDYALFNISLQVNVIKKFVKFDD